MLLYGLIALSLILLLPLAVRPWWTVQRTGRMFALLAIVIAPGIAGYVGLETHVERSKTVAFCTSCHVMEAHGRSLHVDDIDHLAAKHFVNGRVPRETACFACHTNYTMYGDFNAKLRGLRHVWVQYLGTVPTKLALYSPYNNRECLHCHENARPFVEAVSHKPELANIRSNKMSCLTKGCHDVVHGADHLDGLAMWPAEKGAAP